MEIEDYETIYLAQEIARKKGWDHVMETIREALRNAMDKSPAEKAAPEFAGAT